MTTTIPPLQVKEYQKTDNIHNVFAERERKTLPQLTYHEQNPLTQQLCRLLQIFQVPRILHILWSYQQFRREQPTQNRQPSYGNPQALLEKPVRQHLSQTVNFPSHPCEPTTMGMQIVGPEWVYSKQTGGVPSQKYLENTWDINPTSEGRENFQQDN